MTVQFWRKNNAFFSVYFDEEVLRYERKTKTFQTNYVHFSDYQIYYIYSLSKRRKENLRNRKRDEVS